MATRVVAACGGLVAPYSGGLVTAPDDIGPFCLVTGGGGFFGRSLVTHLLDEGYRVRVLDLARHPALDRRAELHVADVRDPQAVAEAVSGASSVFHTASLISLSGVANRALRARAYDVNVRGTEHVIAACRLRGVKRLVYTSTNNVALPAAHLLAGDESTPYAEAPFDLYTQTKIAAEQRVLAAGRGGELKTCALRPGGIWGPGAGGIMLEKVLDAVALGLPLMRIGHGPVEADNTHVGNLAEAHLLAARALAERPERVSGEAYFITDDEPMDPLEWFAPLLAELGVAMPRLALPGALAYGIGYAAEWLERLTGIAPPLTRVEVLKVTRSHSFRIDKAREELGYVPRVTRAFGLPACAPYARAYLARRRRWSGRQS